jgi:hypothetical protein
MARTEKVFGGSSKSAHLGEHSLTMNALRKDRRRLH